MLRLIGLYDLSSRKGSAAAVQRLKRRNLILGPCSIMEEAALAPLNVEEPLMKKLRPQPGKSNKGSVAVELAITLLVFTPLLSAVLFFGIVFWSYTVATKAAHDAARFLAAATPREMQPDSSGSEVQIVGVARKIILDEVSEIRPFANVGTTIQCYSGTYATWDTCFGFEQPKKILVRVTIFLNNPFVGNALTQYTGGYVLLKPVMVVPYAGQLLRP